MLSLNRLVNERAFRDLFFTVLIFLRLIRPLGDRNSSPPEYDPKPHIGDSFLVVDSHWESRAVPATVRRYEHDQCVRNDKARQKQDGKIPHIQSLRRRLSSRSLRKSSVGDLASTFQEITKGF